MKGEPFLFAMDALEKYSSPHPVAGIALKWAKYMHVHIKS